MRSNKTEKPLSPTLLEKIFFAKHLSSMRQATPDLMACKNWMLNGFLELASLQLTAKNDPLSQNNSWSKMKNMES